jgi:multidrug efflux system membrane fusion protein
VMADKAVVQNAKLMLSYCYIRAPVSGRTGSLLAHTGDLIKADDVNSMVVINQIQPTYASFAVPELRLPEIKKYMAVAPLKVLAAVSGQNRPPEQGVMTFLDNAIDTATGTIKLKATFPNAEKTLWPGQFVNVTLELTELTNALVVPSQAVMTGQNGQYIYVVKPDMSAESRPVVAGQVFQNLTVVEKGIVAGETVVTDGQLQLVPGTKVEIKSPEAGAATPGSASGGVMVPGTSASPPAGSGSDSK